MEELVKSAFDWVCTDNSCCQQTKALDANGRMFELYQVCMVPNSRYMVAHAVIDLDTYNEDDIKTVLSFFGYDSMEDFREMNPYNGSNAENFLDMETARRAFENELIAEMLFESSALESLVEGLEWDNYEDAEEYILNTIRS